MFYRNGFRVRALIFSIFVVWIFSVSIASSAPPFVFVPPPPPATDVITIEQDWRVEFRSVDIESYSPQFISGFPIPGTDFVLQYTWNHLDYPEFFPGGVQFQIWDNNTFANGFNGSFAALSNPNEVLTWTHSITIFDEGLSATLRCIHTGLSALQSTTWGDVILPNQLPIESYALIEVQSLNDYTPEMSVAESAVMFGANHVLWFGIVETRYYNYEGQLLSTDSTPRVIFQPPAAP